MIEQVQVVGFVEARRPHAEDDFWGGEEACIALIDSFTADSLKGDFSLICTKSRDSDTVARSVSEVCRNSPAVRKRDPR